MSKVLLKELSVPAVPIGETHLMTLSGKKLSESPLRTSLPGLGVSVLNESSNAIKVYVNEEPTNAFRISPNASRGLSGIPFMDLSIVNLGATEIAADEVTVTIINDFRETREYLEAKRLKTTIL